MLTIWNQQPHLITAGSAFNSSEPLAVGSLVWVKQSVKLMRDQSTASKDDFDDEQCSSKDDSDGLPPQLHRLNVPSTHDRWWLVHTTNRKSERNPNFWGASNHQGCDLTKVIFRGGSELLVRGPIGLFEKVWESVFQQRQSSLFPQTVYVIFVTTIGSVWFQSLS